MNELVILKINPYMGNASAFDIKTHNIAFFQAVTQMQEQTLTFVPKILAMVVAASIFIPWISERMVTFTRTMFQELPW